MMIELEKVTKRYGPAPGRTRPVDALGETTLQVPEGAVWAVVGPNGAGKTTLLALTLGFLQPTTGRVRLAGLTPRRYLRRHGAAFLPERFQLPAEWPVDAALLALARLEGLDRREARERTGAAIDRFGLGPHRTKPIGTLSRGLLQRVGLAQAILAERRLIILDEPTEGLDPIWRIEFRELIGEFRRDGRTVLIASHDLAEVERMTDRAVLLEDGKLRQILDIHRPPEEKRVSYQIELADPSPAIFELFPGTTTAGPNTYLVTVTDGIELSNRLAALLAEDAILESVTPITEPLEARIHRALSGGTP